MSNPEKRVIVWGQKVRVRRKDSEQGARGALNRWFRDLSRGLALSLILIHVFGLPVLADSVTAYPSTPEGVVRAFCNAEFNLQDFEGLLWGRFDQRKKYVTKDFVGGDYDSIGVVRGFRISRTHRQGASAEIIVVYQYLGSLRPDDFFPDKRLKEVVYGLVRQNGQWKISWPADPPYVSLATAIKFLEWIKKKKEQSSEDVIKPAIKYMN